MDTEAFEQGDEAQDEASRLDDSFIEQLEQDPSLDPTLQADQLELEELGADFDDPESLAVLYGGIDEPDGVGVPFGQGAEDEGWDLDQPITRPTAEDDDEEEDKAEDEDDDEEGDG